MPRTKVVHSIDMDTDIFNQARKCTLPTPVVVKEQEATLSIHHFRHKDWETSATFSAALSIENDGFLVDMINKARRIDGTISVQSMEAVFREGKDRNDSLVSNWAEGETNIECLAEYFNDDIEERTIPDVIVESLRSALITETTIKLTSQLSREDYANVNKVIEAMGGTWSRKDARHVFKDRNAEDAVLNFLETGKLDEKVRPTKFGYFPTPIPLVRELVSSAKLTPQSIVLEPEAGTGNIVSVVAEFVPKEQITCYEIQPQHCETVRKMGFIVHQADFLTIEPDPRFNVALLNPPFEKKADIDHVLHAYKFLVPGGTLCAIMSYGTVFRSDTKTTDFRKFLEEHNADIVEIDAGAFKESGTQVKTIRIALCKPAVIGPIAERVQPKQEIEQLSLEFA